MLLRFNFPSIHQIRQECMSGRGSSPGLFGIVGGLLWGAPRSHSPSGQENASLDDNVESSSPSGSEATKSSNLKDHEDREADDMKEASESVNIESDSGGDDNDHSASEYDNQSNGHGDDDDSLTYEGELISEMAYRTIQLHLKSMGIKCTGKKKYLLKTLKAAVQSGSADRLRSLRHASPMHPYPHESTRTPKRKRLSSPSAHSQTQSSPPTTRSTRSRRERGRQTKNSSGMVPGLDIPGDSAVKGRPKRRSTRTSDAEDSIPATPASGRASGGKGSVPGKGRASARARRKAVKETPPASEEDESEEEGASSVSRKGTATTTPKQASKLSAPPVAPQSPRMERDDVSGGGGSDSEPYFSSEESPVHMPAPTPVLHSGASSSAHLTARIGKVPSSVGGAAGGEGTGSVDLANISTVSTGGGSSIKGEDVEDGASLIDSMSAIDAVSVAATVGSMPDEERLSVDLADLPPPPSFPHEGKLSLGESYGSVGFDDDRSSGVSFAVPPATVGVGDGSALPVTGGAISGRTALDAIGQRFIEMLKGEGPEMSEAEFKIYQSLLESKRHGPAAAAVSEAMRSLGSIMSPPSTAGTARSGSAGTVPGRTAWSDVSRSSTASPREGNKENDSERSGLISPGALLRSEREETRRPEGRWNAGREGPEESFDYAHTAPSGRKRSVAEAGLSGADWRRQGRLSWAADSSYEDDDESSHQGRHKRQYRGDSSEHPGEYRDGWALPAHRDSTDGWGGGGRMSMMSNDASYYHPYSSGERQQAYEPPPPPAWQQDREWMAPRRHSFMPPQPHLQHQQQTSPRYSTHSMTQTAYTPRFQESGGRFSQSSPRGGYGQPASSGMAPVSLQVQQQKSLTPGMSSVQRRLMKRRLAGTSHSSSDGSYSGSYGTTRAAAATASGAVAKRILDTLGDITSSLDEQRRKPLPVATPSTVSTRGSGGALTSAESTRNSVRFAADTTDGHDPVRRVGFAATPTSSESSSTALRNRKGTPHGAAAGLSALHSAASSASPGDEDDYDDRRASTSSDQLWSRQTGRGQSLSPPAPQSKAGSVQESDIRLAATFPKEADDSDNEFQFVSPTRIEGLEDDDMDVLQSKKSSVHFAFSPPGKTKGPKKMISRPATPAAALKTAPSPAGVADEPKVPSMKSFGDHPSPDRHTSEGTAPAGSGFVESIWKRPNTVQCEVCLVYNEENATKCVSCESKMGTAPDTSRRPDATASTSTTTAGTSGGFTGFGAKGTAGAASKTAVKSSGFTFGAPKPGDATAADKGSSAEAVSKQSTVSFGGSKVPSSGFQFGSAPKADAAKDSSTKDEAKTPAPATAATKPSFGFTAGASKVTDAATTGGSSSAPSLSIGSDKKFSGFAFSSSAKTKATDPASADSSGGSSQAPAAKVDTPAPGGGNESFSVPPVTASKPAFGFLSGSKSQSAGDPPKPGTASFGVTGSASSASSGMDFTKKISSSSSISSGFAFGSKKATDEPSAPVSNSTNVAADKQRQGPEEEDEDRGRKRANVTTDTAPASAPPSSGFSFGKGAAGLGGVSSTPTLTSTPSTTTGAKPAFGFLSSTSKQPPSVKDTGEAPKPTGGFAFQTNTPTPSGSPATDKAPSTSFKFGSSTAAEKPATAVKGPFGAASLGQSAPTASAPFGASAASGNASKPVVTGVFGSGKSTSGSSSFTFAPSNAAPSTSTGVSFKFGQTKSQAASSDPSPASSTAPSSGFKGFGGFTGSAATPAKETAPPPPYGSESPGSGMDTGYASGDASNMSTGALPPAAVSTPSFGSSSFGGGGARFGTGQSTAVGGTPSFGSGTGFGSSAAAKPLSFGSTQGSFSFNSSVAGSSFGSGAGGGGSTGGGIAFGQGSSSFPQQQSSSSGIAATSSSGFSLGSSDKKQQPGRRKLKAKKFA